MTGDAANGLSDHQLLLEMRSDLKALTVTVEAIARDQALGVERRVNMQRTADVMLSRLDQHDRELDDLRRWRDRADGALVLARWALGASLVSLVAVAVQFVRTLLP